MKSIEPTSQPVSKPIWNLPSLALAGACLFTACASVSGSAPTGTEERPSEEQQAAIKTIGGKEVPPDTQGPKTVQGSSDAIKGTQYKEGRPQPTGSGGTTPRPGDKPAKKDPRAKIENADDPLAGIDK